MIQDIISQLRVKDGPLYVNQVSANRGLSTVYAVQLTSEFCERYIVPVAGIIKLETLTARPRTIAEEFRVMKFFNILLVKFHIYRAELCNMIRQRTLSNLHSSGDLFHRKIRYECFHCILIFNVKIIGIYCPF